MRSKVVAALYSRFSHYNSFSIFHFYLFANSTNSAKYPLICNLTWENFRTCFSITSIKVLKRPSEIIPSILPVFKRILAMPFQSWKSLYNMQSLYAFCGQVLMNAGSVLHNRIILKETKLAGY